VVTVVRQLVFPDARWWNLVMAGLLLVVLAGYLWQKRQRKN
jgi:LPXTG-motif cell wall-anchored protein